jgi:hypothetical protein
VNNMLYRTNRQERRIRMENLNECYLFVSRTSDIARDLMDESWNIVQVQMRTPSWFQLPQISQSIQEKLQN